VRDENKLVAGGGKGDTIAREIPLTLFFVFFSPHFPSQLINFILFNLLA